MKISSITYIIACGLLAMPASNGALRTFNVTGEITAGRNFFEVGDSVLMTFSYDDSATGTVSGGETQGSYVGDAQGVFDMALQITTEGSVWTSTATTGNIGIYNPGTTGGDSFQVTSTLPPAFWTSPINGFTPEAFKIELVNQTGNTFDNVDLPSSLAMSDFTKLTGTIYLDDFGFFSSVHFNVTDIQAVPEPGEYALLFGLLSIGAAAYWRKRR